MESDKFNITISATLQMYLECLRKSSRFLLQNWIIIPASVAAVVTFFLLAIPLSGFGMAGGFIMGMIQICLLSFYYSWISETCAGSKLAVRDLLEFDYSMFFQVISVAFLFFIISLVLSMQSNSLVIVSVNLGLFLIFNAIPEVIHQDRLESFSALQQAASFTKENWIEWYLPLVILLIPSIILSSSGVLLTLAGTEPLLPVFTVIRNIMSLHYFFGSVILLILIGIILGNWFMIFRGCLYNELKTGTRRQRIFKARQ